MLHRIYVNENNKVNGYTLSEDELCNWCKFLNETMGGAWGLVFEPTKTKDARPFEDVLTSEICDEINHISEGFMHRWTKNYKCDVCGKCKRENNRPCIVVLPGWCDPPETCIYDEGDDAVWELVSVIY